MGLLKKGKKKKLRSTGRGAATTQSPLRPVQELKAAPCAEGCAAHVDARGWLMTIGQREKLGLSEDEALAKAWEMITEANPFPATMGRVCPHPCETHCNRGDKDERASINALERFVGDYGLEKELKLKKIEADEKTESIGVVGAGPAGLSFAYQMARRGYPVTVYEKLPKPGGMLYYGIPFYRLPETVLLAEIQRIVDLGVDLQLGTGVGSDVTVDEIQSRHEILFLGIGAHKGKLLRVPGEDGNGVWSGTGYLNRINSGEKIDLGKKVVVIGGGDTAIDAARVARRTGADVTILYRRTRTEMPAIETEIEDALKEDVAIEYLVAPVEIKRSDDSPTAIVVQKMELGEPDDSGRRRPVPIEGSEYDVPVDSVIAAISQEPDFEPIPALGPTKRWLEIDEHNKIVDKEKVYTGGDALDLGIAATAVYHGRWAAESVHAVLRGEEPPPRYEHPSLDKNRVKLDFYDKADRNERTHRPKDEWLAKPDDEIDLGLTREQALAEAGRCMSCGICFGCERCWMYCTPACFKKVDDPSPGNFFTVKMDVCDGCKKCADECPCGFLDMR